MDLFRLADALWKSGYFSDIKDASQALVKLLAGRELGIGPIAALQGVYVVAGRPAYAASLVATVIQQSGRWSYRVVTLTESECELAFFEASEQVGTSRFTIEDAKQAGLLAGRNAHSWKHYPRNMLFARALTNGARWYCMGAFGGVTPYTPEELGEAVGPKPGREPDPALDSEFRRPDKEERREYDEHIEAIVRGD